MFQKILVVACLGLFALAVSPVVPILSDASGMSAEAATVKKKKAPMKRVAKKSNVQSKVSYDSGARRWMTTSDRQYRYGR